MCSCTAGIWRGRRGWLLAIPTLLLSLTVVILLGFGTWTAALAVGITSIAKVWAWVKDNAESFGFSWEGAREGQPGWEPWHLRYVAGDKTPARVLDMQAFFKAHA